MDKRKGFWEWMVKKDQISCDVKGAYFWGKEFSVKAPDQMLTGYLIEYLEENSVTIKMWNSVGNGRFRWYVEVYTGYLGSEDKYEAPTLIEALWKAVEATS